VDSVIDYPAGLDAVGVGKVLDGFEGLHGLVWFGLGEIREQSWNRGNVRNKDHQRAGF
jgi:hypothetical protein